MPILTPILIQGSQGDPVKAVQTDLGKIGVTLPTGESSQSLFGAGTVDAIKVFQVQNKLPVTGTVDAVTQTMLNNAAAVWGTNQSRVSGLLIMDYGLAANGVTVRLYSIGFGGLATKLAEAKTDANGVYFLPYAPLAAGANVQVRVVDGQGKETAISSVVYNAPAVQVLNLVAPASVQPLTAEYQRLSADMQKEIGGIQNLSKAQESDSQQDLTLLSRSTGWDARVLAMAATAAQQASTTGLTQDVLYTLFRTGLPSDPQTLALIPAATIGTALTKANQSGIVSLSAAQISAAQTAFTAFATKTNMSRKVAGAPSTYNELLAGVITDPGQQSAFAGVLFDPAISSADRWVKLAAAGIPADKIATLKLQGKLALLTGNNANVIQKIQQILGSANDLRALVDANFHLAATWKDAISSIAGNDAQKLQSLIPTTYGAATPADQLEAYAADLARQVCVAYPTRVVAQMASAGSLNLDATEAPKVSAFLKAADSAGYQLGRTPLNTFLKNLPKTVPAPDPPTIGLAKTLHRLYQVTPSTEALQSALKWGFTSARDIAAYTPDQFRARFGSSFPSATEADLVYRKAQQVNAVTLNLFASAKQLDSQPALYALSGSAEERQSAKDAITRQFPSMTGLFGSLDFCQCQDCRSVLSPAAYFVDILHFLDPDPNDWQSIITDWQNSHNGTAYPFGTPFAALTARRPDLPNLNLSCENTNTALPYIDVVNEILEYFVANQGSLQNLIYDTGSATSADLVAEPQNIVPMAYSVLANRATTASALYPLGLPFDLWIETVRGFLDHFKLPLWRILEVFRPAESLELFTDANDYPYYQSAIFMESLGISPAEFALFINQNIVSNWFTLYGYSDQATAGSGLASAETLAGRLGISYQNLVDILETGFLNPSLVPLTIPLRKFELSLRDVFTYTGQPGYNVPPLAPAQKTTFETNLQKLTEQYYPNTDPKALQNWLTGLLAAGYSNQVLVLKAPSENSCDFQHTAFQYAGGSPADSLAFLKLNLFVRIWKKLGWSIDEVDRALQLFLTPWLPAANDPNLSADLAKAVAGSLIYLSHLQALFENLQSGPYNRIGILPIWSPNIPTTGENPLYARLFLTDAVLNSDPIFDNPAGEYLCYFDASQGKYLPFRWQSTQTADDVPNGYVLLGNHLTAIQGAIGLTATEVDSILGDNQLDIASAPLTLANVSLLYRYVALSHGLGFSVDDFIALKEISVDLINRPPLNSLNPFDSLAATPVAVLRDDHPWGETLQFSKQAATVQASGFSVPDLQYLLRHRIADPDGPYNQDPAAAMQQVRSLAATIHAIQGQTAIPSDAATFTNEVIRQKISQVFPANVAQTFMGMWADTIQYTATPVNSANPIPSGVLSSQFSVQLIYDATELTQTMILTGVPTSAVMNGLSAQLATLTANGTITPAQQTMMQGLLNDIRTQALTFFQAYLQQSTVGSQITGFLLPGDFETLFASPTGMAAMRASLAAKFLPYLQNLLVSQAIIQALTTQLGADASLTKTLLTNTAVLSDPTQAATPSTPLLAAFKATADIGVSVTYFSGSLEESTTMAGSATATTINTDKATNAARPATINSARFEGYLEVPADGPYNFMAILPNNAASAALKFDFLTGPLTLNAGTPSGSPAIYPYSGYTQFKAGVPYHFTVDFQDLSGGDAKLLVQGEALPQGPLSQLTLYPETSVQRYLRAQILLDKAWRLIQGFELDENEVVYIATHSADFNNISFAALPTQASDDSTPKAKMLFGQFLRLANYGDLKKGPAGGTDGLINVFRNARQTIPVTPLPAGVTSPLQSASQNFYQAVANLTRRDSGTVQAVTMQLWGTEAIQTATTGTGAQAQFQFTVTPLVNDLGFRRLWEALQMAQTLGVQSQVLKQTTAIAYPSRGATSGNPDPGQVLASALRNAVKSQYTPDQWRPVAQSIFDSLRQKKRDALCAYILNLPAIKQFGAVDINGLFEYFLVDPGMEPVVQTSRIRLALSSVQTFIQRCLLDLELQVKPSIIDSNRWDWMKRYRVWEANRKIFLWPENWLIPEFRENATDLFQALQGTLLQGDITEDLVEQAFTQYLQDLDTRARLDIVSLFKEQPAAGNSATSDTLHVIGRHHGKPAKYFYRTFSNGVWSGWIPVTPDIEGDHVVAVIWRGRLNVFWLTFVVQGGPAATPAASQTNLGGTTGSNKLTDLSLNDLSNILVTTGEPAKTVQIQLNWSEYYQGKWTPRKSSDINRFVPIQVSDNFAPTTGVYVHASVDTDDSGAETAVRIHLDGIGPSSLFFGRGVAFRLTGKNSEPVCSAVYWQPNYVPYTTAGWDATKNLGYVVDPPANAAGAPIFQNSYLQELSVVGGTSLSSGFASNKILQNVNSFSLLLCDNLPMLDWSGTWAFFMSQIGALSSPFFYEDTSDPKTDQELTFFVQPTVTETSFKHWDGWGIISLPPDQAVNDSKYWDNINLTSQAPIYYPPPSPDPEAAFPYRSNLDWMTNESTLFSYGPVAVGREGGIGKVGIITGGTASLTQGRMGRLGSPGSIATTGGLKIITGAGSVYAGALSLAMEADNRNATSHSNL
jgi:Neuraminidase-like domain/Putative peptidoglycan binding domain/Salmonella virulence plasmid 28.1kDa A protein